MSLQLKLQLKRIPISLSLPLSLLFSSGNFLEPSKSVAPKRTTPVPTKASTRRKNRPRRPSPSPSTTTSTARYESYSPVNRAVSTSSTTTPSPPTTPDSGTDFKCEDEGFYSHPRDCKKYFWCLDSGPSQLGIVAHQFTCPSGLVFNKLADSCDYTRNVVCSKTKPSTTTARSTTAFTTTTTAAPRTTAPKRNYASIRPLVRGTKATTTSTTTEAYAAEEDEEYDEEEEEYDEETAGGGGPSDASQSGFDSEDPKVIKELIDLIKKVGGIEELEKQLKQNQDGSHVLYNPNQSTVTTTPSPSIHKKLYEKILRKPIPGVQIDVAEVLRAAATASTTTEASSVPAASPSSQSPKYSSIYRATNSRPAPQNEGLDKYAETDGLRNEKPQYITITRNRPSVATPVPDEEVDDEEEEEDISIARSTESTFVRYTIPEHVEVTGHDASYRVSSSGFDGQTQPASSTPYVTIQRTTARPKSSGGGDKTSSSM